MKALILNSGLGHRMGVITKEHPKCMTEVSAHNTILSRQLRQLVAFGSKDVVITTGYYDIVLMDYCNSLHFPLNYTFVNNPIYELHLKTFGEISIAMGIKSGVADAINAFKSMLEELEIANPTTNNRESDLQILSTSVNPIRLNNSPIALNDDAI